MFAFGCNKPSVHSKDFHACYLIVIVVFLYSTLNETKDKFSSSQSFLSSSSDLCGAIKELLAEES